ncbi:MAG: helix-turn-helix domain-containing protein [Deltaproteobacteria bacterium]|nr:helix-turn-helix domain-containing protein [Deltaproteobacteria bacterium]
MRETRLALHQVLRFIPRHARAVVEIVSKKRPEVIVRRTRYAGAVVDERVLTRAFAWIPRSPALQAIVLLEGSARLWPHDGGADARMVPGDAVLLTPSDASMGRFEDATYLDLEWLPDALPRKGAIERLARVDLERASRLGEEVATGATADRTLFEQAFALFRAIGAPLGGLSAATVERAPGRPSAQDIAIAQAITAQVADLRSSATALSFGEHAGMSPRQLQRILASYFERYRMNATNWRDMRNRYRIHIAITLLSIPDLPIATIADEVGYASPAALARAFADRGLPTPGEMRAEIARMAG